MSSDDPLRRRFAASAPLMAEQTASQADELGDRVARFAGLVGTERVLDAGTGTGTLALGIAAHAREVVAVDLVPELLAEARLLARDRANISFVQADVLALPFEQGTFDLAASSRTLHHVARPELLIAELARVTRPGGRVLLIDQLASHDPLEAMVHDRIERLRIPRIPGRSRIRTSGGCSTRTRSFFAGSKPSVRSVTWIASWISAPATARPGRRFCTRSSGWSSREIGQASTCAARRRATGSRSPWASIWRRNPRADAPSVRRRRVRDVGVLTLGLPRSHARAAAPRSRAGHVAGLHAPPRVGRAARLPVDLLRAGWAHNRSVAAHELCGTGRHVLAGVFRGFSARTPALAPASSLPCRNRHLPARSDALSDPECDGGPARGGFPPAPAARARGARCRPRTSKP